MQRSVLKLLNIRSGLYHTVFKLEEADKETEKREDENDRNPMNKIYLNRKYCSGPSVLIMIIDLPRESNGNWWQI
jgi:hypothetical protein